METRTKNVELTNRELAILLDCMDEAAAALHPASQRAKSEGERGALRAKLIETRYGRLG